MSGDERERLANIIGDIAVRAAALPKEERPAFKGVVARLREVYSERHRTDAVT